MGAAPFHDALRAFLVSRFGDGEGGLRLPGPPGSARDRAGSLVLDRKWNVVRERKVPALGTDLAGGWAETSGRAAATIEGAFREARILLLRQPGGGTATLRVDGRVVERRRLSSASMDVDVARLRGEGGSRTHVIEIDADGDGLVRLLGVVLETGRPGAVYSPVGVNGAIAASLLALPEPLLTAQLAAVDPDLVILAYGTNEARMWGLDQRTLADQMAAVISRVRRAVPRASVLVVAPPDQARRTRSGEIAPVPAREVVSRAFFDASRREAALFVDLAEAMGGRGAMRAWSAQSPPLVREDLVHFTAAGYLRLARLFAEELDGRETMHRIPRNDSLPSGEVRFTRDAAGRIHLTNLAPSPVGTPVLARNRR